MKKLITLLLLFIPFLLIAQDSYIKNRWNITMEAAREQDYSRRNYTIDYRLAANYGLLNELEVGVYFGLASFRTTQYLKLVSSPYYDPQIYKYRLNRYSYGITAKYQVFPLFIKTPTFKLDLYLIGKIGAISHALAPNTTLGWEFRNAKFLNKFYPEFSIGPGLSFHFFKYVGLFTEVNWGRFHGRESRYFEWRYGISIQF